MIRSFSLIVCCVVMMSSFLSLNLEAQTKNGFNLSGASVNIEEIVSGGPPRDGIPSIDNPEFITVEEVDYLDEDDIVLGLVREDSARAYPKRILVCLAGFLSSDRFMETLSC